MGENTNSIAFNFKPHYKEIFNNVTSMLSNLFPLVQKCSLINNLDCIRIVECRKI